MNAKRIVITGGPGTGKSSIIDELKHRGQVCYEEISRQVTLDARKTGVEQLFLAQPLLFSQLLLKGRAEQYEQAGAHADTTVFLDRGLPDVLAYMDFFHTAYPDDFVHLCKNNRYNTVFVLAPWQEIFTGDSERYESFEESKAIHSHLLDTYQKFDYDLVNVPFGPVHRRTDFILDYLNR